MKLKLIVPATNYNLKRRQKVLTPPLGMATVAALTPPDKFAPAKVGESPAKPSVWNGKLAHNVDE